MTIVPVEETWQAGAIFLTLAIFPALAIASLAAFLLPAPPKQFSRYEEAREKIAGFLAFFSDS